MDVDRAERTLAADEQQAPVVTLVALVGVRAVRAQVRHDVVDRHPVVHGGDDVENGLGLQAGHRRAPDVDHGHGEVTEQRGDDGALPLAQGGPVGIVGRQPHLRLVQTEAAVRDAGTSSPLICRSAPLAPNVASAWAGAGQEPEAAMMGPFRWVPDMSPSLGASPKFETLPSAVTTQ